MQPNDREIYLDAPDEVAPAPVDSLTDEPEIDTGYDPGNPWWTFCLDYEQRMEAIYEQRRQHWDSLSADEKEACRQFVQEHINRIRDFQCDDRPKIIEAAVETNRFILRALEKERIDREARASGVDSPCSLDTGGCCGE